MLTKLPSAICKYRERFPEVRFTLRELSTAAIEEPGLSAGQIDIGFLRGPAPFAAEFALAPEFTFEEQHDRRAARRAPAGRTIAPDLETLGQGAFVLFPRRLGGAFYDELLAYCVAAGFTPRIVQEATQWQSVVTFVETGMGVSITPACVEKFRRNGVWCTGLCRG